MTQSATIYNQLMEDNDLVTLYVSINELTIGAWINGVCPIPICYYEKLESMFEENIIKVIHTERHTIVTYVLSKSELPRIQKTLTYMSDVFCRVRDNKKFYNHKLTQ